jgi:hypothetical protein
MLSVLLGTTTITMNRGEQETLYRQARNLRLHQESKAQLNNPKPRHHSYGNIHQIHQIPSSVFAKNFTTTATGMNIRSTLGNDDLVLSVLKSPLRDQSLLSNLSSVAATSVNSECESVNRLSTVTQLTTTTIDDNNQQAPSPQGIGGRDYSTLRTSEDDLVDNDVELALETTELNDNRDINNSDLSPYGGLKFLKRFRTNKFEPHHRRVPTPMKRKHNRSRSKSSADILDGVNGEPNVDETDEVATNGTHDMDGGFYSIYISFIFILFNSFQ